MTAGDPDRLFADIAVERGLLDAAQAAECRRVRDEVAKAGVKVGFAKVAQDRGLLSAAQVRDIFGEVRRRGTRPAVAAGDHTRAAFPAAVALDEAAVAYPAGRRARKTWGMPLVVLLAVAVTVGIVLAFGGWGKKGTNAPSRQPAPATAPPVVKPMSPAAKETATPVAAPTKPAAPARDAEPSPPAAPVTEDVAAPAEPPPLRRPVTLTAPYPAMYKDARTDVISVQYAVMAVLGQAHILYDRAASARNTGPACRTFVRPEIRNLPCDEALTAILGPVGLTYEMVGGRVVLKKK